MLKSAGSAGSAGRSGMQGGMGSDGSVGKCKVGNPAHTHPLVDSFS